MAKLTKKKKQLFELVDPENTYSLEEAMNIFQTVKSNKFDESVDIALRLGVDPGKSDQNVRGAITLPHSLGKTVTVAVFADGDQAKEANDSGADFVGMEDLAEKFKKEEIDVDVVISSQAAMKIVGQLGQVLGPKGLMPNPKTGTVTDDTAKAVKEVKAGRVEYKLDKGANIQVLAGKASFSSEQIIGNIKTIIDEVIKAKPSAAKGRYIDNCVLSSSMSPGIPLDLREVLKGL